MAFVTKDQKAKTVARILYERFILVFGAPAKLLSDRRANFTSALVKSSVRHLPFRNAGLQPIMHSVMDKWRDFTKPYSG